MRGLPSHASAQQPSRDWLGARAPEARKPESLTREVGAVHRFLERGPEPDDTALAERAIRNRHAAAHFYSQGRGNDTKGVAGTLWAAYNGVAEYIDHRKLNKRAGDYNQARLSYVWFGGGAAIKQRALVHALERADPERLRLLELQ